MKVSVETIGLMLFGLFGILSGIFNWGLYQGGRWYGKGPSKETRRYISIIVGLIILVIGLGLLNRLNVT